MCRKNVDSLCGPRDTVLPKVRSALGHYTNPLHVYCRLRDLGISPGLARFLSRAYEDWRWCLLGLAVGASAWVLLNGVL